MFLTDTFVIWRAERLLRNAARRERRRLARELSTYDTQASRNDLLAAFDRYPDEATDHLRETLVRRTWPQQTARDWPAFRPGQP